MMSAKKPGIRKRFGEESDIMDLSRGWLIVKAKMHSNTIPAGATILDIKAAW